MSTKTQTWMIKDIKKDASLCAENHRQHQPYTKNKKYRQLSKAESGRGIPHPKKSTPIVNQVPDGQSWKYGYK